MVGVSAVSGVTVNGAPRVFRTALRAWGLSVLALVTAGAGMAVLTASSSTTSLVRMGIAAAVLSVYAAAIGLLTTLRGDRTRWRCLLWGGAIPAVVGMVTGIVVAGAAGAAAGALAAVPWLVGTLVAWGAGPYLPGFRLPSMRRLLRRGNQAADR